MTTVAQAGVDTPAAGPVIRDDLTAEQYHADLTSISSTGLRELLDPGCPAQFHYDRHHPKPPKREFDFGNAVHAAVLGKGSDIVEIDYPNYLKADARAQRDIAYDDGKIPLLPKEKEQVDAMAAAILRHSLAGPLFAPGNGIAERSVYWTDPATSVRCRVRPDWLIVRPEVTVVVDLKTTTDANPKACSKAIAAYSYHQQGALYLDGVQAAGLAPEGARFLFVFQSKKAPYLVTVRELGDQDQDIGRARNERALRLYADCEATGLWPDWTGPVDEIPQISMPSYDTIRQAEEYL
ncbi:PD-(D/E)XK nuclease-like domain-containing protein [Streptomyces europaeiscabiei]|uniref:PD-(D/E)XK nuclease-like domain-containing protein n=1 Tax=Streptomyces europaeiscabiei TaxID=146819 RepID=UPI0029B1143C|nr:PD-(D/E)XK nuclease-like domain-containing protein [Streptomyces europaeiscabiei]MDX3835653.1 PD-(D/E)XK nuclease-like domain-containing protein [Streptomyces europaeiscabiei]